MPRRMRHGLRGQERRPLPDDDRDEKGDDDNYPAELTKAMRAEDRDDNPDEWVRDRRFRSIDRELARTDDGVDTDLIF